MAKRTSKSGNNTIKKKPIEQYEHKDKDRLNNLRGSGAFASIKLKTQKIKPNRTD